MQRIIIIGNKGFVGRHTEEYLKEKGYDVKGYDIRGDVEWDITIPSDVLSLISKDNIVINLAAIASFKDAEDGPFSTFMVNTLGNLNIIRAAIQNKAKKVIIASSGSVYSKKIDGPINEDSALAPNSIYALSKRFAEMICCYYADKVPIVILRYAHLYGPYEQKGGVAAFCKKLIKDEVPTIFGGTQTNDFTYIRDVCQANELAIRKLPSGIYNVGTGVETSIKEVYSMVAKTLGKNHIQPEVKPLRKVDWPRFVYDISKMRKFGYKPKWSLVDGIKKTVKWWVNSNENKENTN